MSSAPATVDACTPRQLRRRVAALRAWPAANIKHTQAVLTFAAGWARGSDTANQTLIGLGEALCWVHDEHETLVATAHAGRDAEPHRHQLSSLMVPKSGQVSTTRVTKISPIGDPLERLGAMVRGEVQRQLYSELVAVVRARH